MLKIIMLALFLPVLLIIYLVLRNEAKAKKNLILGVTLPHDARAHDTVLSLVRQYQLALGVVSVVLALLTVPTLFLRYDSVVMTYLMTWLLVMLLAPMVCYGLYNKRLMALKRHFGWYSESSGTTLVDTRLLTVPRRLVSVWVFAPAFLLSLIPVVVTVLTLRRGDEFWPTVSVYLLMAMMVALFYVLYRVICRQRAEVVDEKTEINAALTQIRRYNWGKCWIWTAWLTCAFNIGLWLFQQNAYIVVFLSLVYTGVLLFVLLRAEFRTRRQQERLTADSGREVYTDDDDNWRLGMFYWNPRDKHLIVNKRTGLGTTLNMAGAAGKAIILFTLLLLLAMPFLGVWMMSEEFTPVSLSLKGDALVARHTGTVYELPIGQIKQLGLIEQLPSGSRTMGTEMSSVLKGSFKLDGIGSCRLCVDPRTPPFLVAVTEDRTYILGASEAGAVRALYNALKSTSTAADYHIQSAFDFDKDAAINRAKEVLAMLHTGDYAALYSCFDLETQKLTTVEKLKAAFEPYLTPVGGFVAIEGADATAIIDKNGTKYIQVTLNTKYEKKTYLYTVSFNPELGLEGIHLK